MCCVSRQAARDNVLAAVNPEVFPGYFSVCADGQGFGYGSTYPSLDGLQMSEAMSKALLWLGLRRVAKVGRSNGYSWREHCYRSGTGSVVPAGAENYCEYPANFLRVVNRFLR